MTKPTQTQYIAALAVALCAYFSKYEFEGIKDEQTKQRATLSTLATQSAIQGTMLEQVLRQNTAKLAASSSP